VYEVTSLYFTLWHIVNFLIIAPYKYSYLLTYLHMHAALFATGQWLRQWCPEECLEGYSPSVDELIQ